MPMGNSGTGVAAVAAGYGRALQPSCFVAHFLTVAPATNVLRSYTAATRPTVSSTSSAVERITNTTNKCRFIPCSLVAGTGMDPCSASSKYSSFRTRHYKPVCAPGPCRTSQEEVGGRQRAAPSIVSHDDRRQFSSASFGSSRILRSSMMSNVPRNRCSPCVCSRGRFSELIKRRVGFA